MADPNVGAGRGFTDGVSLESLRAEVAQFAEERDWNQARRPLPTSVTRCTRANSRSIPTLEVTRSPSLSLWRNVTVITQFHTPRNLLLALVGEVGEVSEIFQWRGECKPGLEGASALHAPSLGRQWATPLAASSSSPRARCRLSAPNHLSPCLSSADWSEADKTHLGEELSDVLVYLIRLADRCNVDLTAAAVRKLQKCVCAIVLPIYGHA